MRTDSEFIVENDPKCKFAILDLKPRLNIFYYLYFVQFLINLKKIVVYFFEIMMNLRPWHIK